MIIRIVKMTFREDTVDTFLQMFEKKRSVIQNFPGCLHLELLKGADNPLQFFTYSKWEDEEALANYRRSDFFVKTWHITKKLFSERAEAWSLGEVSGFEFGVSGSSPERR